MTSPVPLSPELRALVDEAGPGACEKALLVMVAAVEELVDMCAELDHEEHEPVAYVASREARRGVLAALGPTGLLTPSEARRLIDEARSDTSGGTT